MRRVGTPSPDHSNSTSSAASTEPKKSKDKEPAHSPEGSDTDNSSDGDDSTGSSDDSDDDSSDDDSDEDEVNPNWEALKDVKKFRLPPDNFVAPRFRWKDKQAEKSIQHDGCLYYVKPR